jgi:hypothetical protein
MRLRWPAWGGQAARRSRPRVAQAIQAARAVQMTQPAQSAWAGGGWSVDARELGGLIRYSARSQRAGTGLSPTLLRATARVARAGGLRPDEVWAEALRDWLVVRELTEDEPVGHQARVSPDLRRTLAWQAIDATLGELRAS